MTKKETLNYIELDDDISCLDCMELHIRDIDHGCHCHVTKETLQLPNLGPLIDEKIESVFYLRERDGFTEKVIGLRLTTKSGTLKIEMLDDKLVVEYDRSI